jgi:hypothetical protein
MTIIFSHGEPKQIPFELNKGALISKDRREMIWIYFSSYCPPTNQQQQQRKHERKVT